MALLAMLLAAGPNGLEKEYLIDELWQDFEVSSQDKVLEITLHRLRKWVCDDEFIIVRGGSVTLDPKRIWTDVHALERVCEAVEYAPANESAANVRRHAKQLLALYAGPFCEGVDYPSVNRARGRLMRRFAAAIQRVGTRLTALGDIVLAAKVRADGLRLAPTADILQHSAAPPKETAATVERLT